MLLELAALHFESIAFLALKTVHSGRCNFVWKDLEGLRFGGIVVFNVAEGSAYQGRLEQGRN